MLEVCSWLEHKFECESLNRMHGIISARDAWHNFQHVTRANTIQHVTRVSQSQHVNCGTISVGDACNHNVSM